jgi:hypothetical protein
MTKFDKILIILFSCALIGLWLTAVLIVIFVPKVVHKHQHVGMNEVHLNYVQ